MFLTTDIFFYPLDIEIQRICSDKIWIVLNFPTQWNSIGRKKKTLEDSAWNLFNFTLLIFRTKQGAWHKRIQLKRGSDFPSTRTTNTVRLILGSQYSIGNPTLHTYSFARIASNEPVYFDGWNKFSVPTWSPWEPNLTHRRQFSYRRRKRFSSSVVFFFVVSSAIADTTRVLTIKASGFYIFR